MKKLDGHAPNAAEQYVSIKAIVIIAGYEFRNTQHKIMLQDLLNIQSYITRKVLIDTDLLFPVIHD
jgi:hypothetical protein